MLDSIPTLRHKSHLQEPLLSPSATTEEEKKDAGEEGEIEEYEPKGKKPKKKSKFIVCLEWYVFALALLVIIPFVLGAVYFLYQCGFIIEEGWKEQISFVFVPYSFVEVSLSLLRAPFRFALRKPLLFVAMLKSIYWVMVVIRSRKIKNASRKWKLFAFGLRCFATVYCLLVVWILSILDLGLDTMNTTLLTNTTQERIRYGLFSLSIESHFCNYVIGTDHLLAVLHVLGSNRNRYDLRTTIETANIGLRIFENINICTYAALTTTNPMARYVRTDYSYSIKEVAADLEPRVLDILSQHGKISLTTAEHGLKIVRFLVDRDWYDFAKQEEQRIQVVMDVFRFWLTTSDSVASCASRIIGVLFTRPSPELNSHLDTLISESAVECLIEHLRLRGDKLQLREVALIVLALNQVIQYDVDVRNTIMSRKDPSVSMLMPHLYRLGLHDSETAQVSIMMLLRLNHQNNNRGYLVYHKAMEIILRILWKWGMTDFIIADIGLRLIPFFASCHPLFADVVAPRNFEEVDDLKVLFHQTQSISEFSNTLGSSRHQVEDRKLPEQDAEETINFIDLVCRLVKRWRFKSHDLSIAHAFILAMTTVARSATTDREALTRLGLLLMDLCREHHEKNPSPRKTCELGMSRLNFRGASHVAKLMDEWEVSPIFRESNYPQYYCTKEIDEED